MSFNIRYGTAEDGDNRWPLRRDLVARVIRAFDPDILGLQEAMRFQIDFLMEQLDGYRWVGRGREVDADAGEFVPIFYKQDRLQVEASGHFWLSKTPHVPGSKSWRSSLPRMATWVDARHEGRSMRIVNTHLDHRSERANVEGARLVAARACEDHAISIVLGDFNASPTMPAHGALTDAGLIDSAEGDDTGSVHDFAAEWVGSRIDWIFHSGDIVTESSAVVRTSFDGRYPSDHFPVTASLRF